MTVGDFVSVKTSKNCKAQQRSMRRPQQVQYQSIVYEGVFGLHFGKLSLDLDFRPDLTIVFFDIPEVLEKLLARGEKPQNLDFCE